MWNVETYIVNNDIDTERLVLPAIKAGIDAGENPGGATSGAEIGPTETILAKYNSLMKQEHEEQTVLISIATACGVKPCYGSCPLPS
jgi:hypothetical protein